MKLKDYVAQLRKIEPKYRIIESGHPTYRYRLQFKVGIFSLWNDMDVYGTIAEAEYNITKNYKSYMDTRVKGKIIKKYNSEDLSIIVLKGEK